MSSETPATRPDGEIAVYETPDGEVRVDVRLGQETVWLTQRQMAQVFDTTPENVQMHLRNVFSSGELEAEATTKDFLVVQTEGQGGSQMTGATSIRETAACAAGHRRPEWVRTC